MVRPAGGSCLHDSRRPSDAGWHRCPSMPPTLREECVPSWMRVVNASWRPDATLPCYSMAVLPHPDVVAGSLCHWGAWEIGAPHDLEDQAGVPRGTLPPPPNGIFLDIGAHIAHFSFVFARAGYSSIAFEPVPRNCATIRASQCLNPQTRVTLFPTALGSPIPRPMHRHVEPSQHGQRRGPMRRERDATSRVVNWTPP